jgi:hypothetical protein
VFLLHCELIFSVICQNSAQRSHSEAGAKLPPTSDLPTELGTTAVPPSAAVDGSVGDRLKFHL